MFTKPVNTKLGIIIYVSLKLSDTKKYQRWLVRFSHACCENLGISIFLNIFFSRFYSDRKEFLFWCDMWRKITLYFVFHFPYSFVFQDVSNIMNVNPAPGGRFHLLPLSALTKHQELSRTGRSDRPTNTLDVKKPTAARKRDRSPVAATAASFFGSMSSSWFGAASWHLLVYS